MTLIRISTQASAQAVGAALGMLSCLVVLALGGLPSWLAGSLIGGLAVAGPLGAFIGARRLRDLDYARPMPPDSSWTSGRVRGPSRILAGPAFAAAWIGLTSTSGESSFSGSASGLLLVLTGVLAARATEALLAAHVERRDDIVLLELRGWWGLETRVVYTVPAHVRAGPIAAGRGAAV